MGEANDTIADTHLIEGAFADESDEEGSVVGNLEEETKITGETEDERLTFKNIDCKGRWPQQ